MLFSANDDPELRDWLRWTTESRYVRGKVPARKRSRMKLLSISEMQPSIVTNSRPVGVLVSTASLAEMIWMLAASTSSMMAMKFAVERAILSKAAVRITEKRSRRPVALGGESFETLKSFFVGGLPRTPRQVREILTRKKPR